MEIFRLFGTVFLQDEAAMRSLNNIERRTETVGSKLGSMIGTMAKWGAAAVAAGVAAASGFAKVGVDFNAMQEQSQIAWTTLLGTADAATKMIKDLQKLGANTPFEFEGLDKSAKLLKAMGVDSKDVLPYLTNIGNAVSAIGGNQETLQGVSMAIGQMLTKGKVSAEEMNQLAERGIPAWELMAQKLNMSKQELMNLSSQGKIYADQALPALLSGMQDKFAGAMEAQSKTFNGQLSTLKDNLKIILGEISGPIFDILKQAMPTVIAAVDKFKVWVNENMPIIKTVMSTVLDNISNNFKTLSGIISNYVIPILQLLYNWIQPYLPAIKQFFTDAFNVIGVVLAAFIEGIKNVIKWLKDWATENQDKLNGIKDSFISIFNSIKIIVEETLKAIKIFWDKYGADIVNIIQTVWNGIVSSMQVIFNILSDILKLFSDMFKGDWKALWEDCKNLFSDIFGGVITIFSNITSILESLMTAFAKIIGDIWINIWTSMKDTFSSIWNTIVTGIKGGINNVIGLLNRFVNGTNDIIGKLNVVPGVNLPNIPNIPMLANGGNILKGGSVLVGERGPELLNLPAGAQVSPLDKGGITIQINNPTLFNDRDADRLGQMLIGRLRVLGVK